MKIVFIGFPACYKSTVGKAVAKKLNKQFIDLDKYIEKSFNAKIYEIINKCGEEKFRSLENEAIARISDIADVVVSCGGGSVLSVNFPMLVKDGVTVWLTATAATVKRRLNGKTRPTFDNLTLSQLEEKMAQRTPVYAKYADITVSTDNLPSNRVTEEVLEKLKKYDL